MTRATLIASLMTLPSPTGAELSAFADRVDWLEVQADLCGDIDPQWLRDRFKGKLLYTLRSREEGGNFAGPVHERRRRLHTAARGYDFVGIEGFRDNADSLLREIPSEKRIVSWQGPSPNLTALKSRFQELISLPARYYKLVIETRQISDEIASLQLLHSLGRRDTIAYAHGGSGFWTRLIAAHLGAPLVFGSVLNHCLADNLAGTEPSIGKLIEDYGLPSLGSLEKLFGIVGSSVLNSLSPRLHNAGYRALTLPALFVPFQVESFEEFAKELLASQKLELLGMPLAGLTVTSPHKEAALEMAQWASPLSRRVGAANILVNEEGQWKADTTDADIVFAAQRELGTKVQGKRAAVIGCGGAGRAVAAALAQSGAEVTLINRSEAHGRHAAELLGLPYIPLEDFDVRGYSIVVNATPVGRDDGAIPCNIERLEKTATVIDFVYGSEPSPLVAKTNSSSRTVIDGYEVLLTQVRRQFELMTKQKMPLTVAWAKLNSRQTPPDWTEHNNVKQAVSIRM